MSRTLRIMAGAIALGVWSVAAPLSAQEGTATAGKGILELTPAMLGQAEEAAAEAHEGNLLGFLEGLDTWGYVETSYTFNFQDSKVGQENRLRVFDVNHNEFDFHNFVMALSKPVGEGNVAGFNVTLALGNDASVSRAAGLFNAGSDIDLWDANVALAVPEDVPLLGETKIYVGKWQTLHGGEVLASPENPNFSRSFLFGFAIPYTHTGVLFERTLPGGLEAVTVKLGIVNGWDNVKDNNNSLSYMGQLDLEPCDWFSMGIGAMWGPEQTTGIAGAAHTNGDYRTLIDLTGRLTVPEAAGMEMLQGLELLLNFDWAGEEGVDPNVGYAQWYGFAGILVYNFALPPLTSSEGRPMFIAFRGEFFDDVDGTRLGVSGTGMRAAVWELTGTIGWRITDNVLFRTELRYDKADTKAFSIGDGSRNHQVTLAGNMVFTF